MILHLPKTLTGRVAMRTGSRDIFMGVSIMSLKGSDSWECLATLATQLVHVLEHTVLFGSL